MWSNGRCSDDEVDGVSEGVVEVLVAVAYDSGGILHGIDVAGYGMLTFMSMGTFDVMVELSGGG